MYLKLLSVFGILGLTFAFGFLDARVLYDMWRWFAVPLGTTRMPLGFVFGLVMAANLALWRPAPIWIEPSREALKDALDGLSVIIGAAAYVCLSWGVAALVARFWTHTL